MAYQDISLERRGLVEEWLETPPTQRKNVLSFRKDLHLSAASFNFIKAQWRIKNALTNAETMGVRREEVVRKNGRGRRKDYHQNEEVENYDSIGFLKTRTQEADEALLAAIQAGNPTAQVTYRKLIGQLIEKQETTHKFELSADDYIRIRKEAERRISEFSGTADRSDGLQPEPSLLPKKICPDYRPD